MFSKCFLNLPWNIFDTIINLLELLVVCVPSICVFMHYKFQTLSIWPREVTKSGATLVIHNKSNKSIFITDILFTNSESGCFKNPVIMSDNNKFQLKPDDYLEVVINYSKNTQKKQSFKIIVKYNKKEKKVKVTA